MDVIVQEARWLAENADNATRSRISSELRQLATSIETPRETIQQYSYLYTYSAVNQIATDLGLFEILSESQESLSTKEIANRCGADPLLTCRLLRLLAAINVISETSTNVFKGNEATKVLASPAGAGGIAHGFHMLNKCFQELPAFLKARNYQSPSNSLDTAFHAAFKTDQHAFQWIQTQPFFLGNFLTSLSNLDTASWTSAVPLRERLHSADIDAPLFVDVGGGPGTQCVAFRKAVKGDNSLASGGRIILQDLPETLEQVAPQEGIEKMAQNFFDAQPVTGAVFYYLRNILHDWPDESCLQILRNQVAAATPGRSTLLIDEMVLPDKGASVMALQQDITMMAVLSGIERTEADWRRLLGEAGLEITQIYRYDIEMGYGIIEAVFRQPT